MDLKLERDFYFKKLAAVEKLVSQELDPISARNAQHIKDLIRAGGQGM
jgi:hypothetical protein